MAHALDYSMIQFFFFFLLITSILVYVSAYIPADARAISELTEEQQEIVTVQTSDYLTLIVRMITLASVQSDMAIITIFWVPFTIIFLIIIAIMIRGFLV